MKIFVRSTNLYVTEKIEFERKKKSRYLLLVAFSIGSLLLSKKYIFFFKDSDFHGF
jgi:hypothetical protein